MHPGNARNANGSVLEEGETCWKVSNATRATLLVDGEDYFATVRQALLKARKQILIAGWDFDSRTLLPPRDSDPASGELRSAPLVLGEFLGYLARTRPGLSIDVVRWAYPWIYRDDRERDTREQLERVGVRFHDDRGHPVTGSVHHKIVVIDGVLGFCGGMDLTHDRWDTSRHWPNDTRRRNLDGSTYMPVHDTVLCVSGPAAQLLWQYLSQVWPVPDARPIAPGVTDELWPDRLRVDFRNVRVGLSRTCPASLDREAIREIEAFYLAAIAATERVLYIENQYFTSPRIAQAIAERCRREAKLEGLLVGMEKPKTPGELHTMGYGLTQFHKILEAAGVEQRAPLVAPISGDRAINLHSKLAIFDDRWLTCGSANLNRRSMGFDVECNLVLEAGDPLHCERIKQIRNRLVGEHLDLDVHEVARAMRTHGIAKLPGMAGRSRRLVPLRPQELRPVLGPILAPLFDREEDWIAPGARALIERGRAIRIP
jgi:phospholipase D1/2